MRSAKIRVLFDGTLLANGHGKGSNRSGIFFVIYNILLELVKFPELDISIYADQPSIGAVRSFLRTRMPGCERLPVVNDPLWMYRNLPFLERMTWRIKDRKDVMCVMHQCLRCQVLRGVLLVFKILRKIRRLLLGTPTFPQFDLKTCIRDFDAVFSPAFPHFPETITSGVRRYTILYDAIPYIYPDLFPDTKGGCSWNLNLLKTLNRDDVCFAISARTKEDFIAFSELFRNLGNDFLAMFEGREGVNAYSRDVVRALRERRLQGLLSEATSSEYDSPLLRENVEVMPLAASETFYECRERRRILAARRKYGIPEGKKYVISLCTLEKRKNILYGIRSFLAFTQENHVEDLVFVLGGGAWTKFVEELESALGDIPDWRKKVLRIGYVDDADLAPLFSGAFCMVYPSLYEGFGLPPLEAMQCGCPVITSDNSSLPEVVGDAGIMIDITDPNALKGAFKRLYDDPSARSDIRRLGIERAKTFSWKRAAEIVRDRMIRDFSGEGRA